MSVLELNGRFTSKVAKVILLDLGLWEFSAIFFGPTTRRQTETCNFTDEQNTDRRLRLQQNSVTTTTLCQKAWRRRARRLPKRKATSQLSMRTLETPNACDELRCEMTSW